MSNPGPSAPLDSVLERVRGRLTLSRARSFAAGLAAGGRPGQHSSSRALYGVPRSLCRVPQGAHAPLPRSSLYLVPSLTSSFTRRPACACCTSSPRRRCRSCSTCATSRSSNASRSSASRSSSSLLSSPRLTSSLSPTRFCSDRLSSLLRTLQLTRLDEYSALQKVAAFATLVATYHEGALVFLSSSLSGLPDSRLSHRLPPPPRAVRDGQRDRTQPGLPPRLPRRFARHRARL